MRFIVLNTTIREKVIIIEVGKLMALEVRPGLQSTKRKGKPDLTIDNFLTVMNMDKQYAGIRFNEMSGNAEVHSIVDGKPIIEKWSDSHLAASEHYMESKYDLYSTQKHEKALRLLFEERRYNPVRDIVDSIEWDGQNRCEFFLRDWALVEDTPYTREVSRLIFAGGINRLYHPGCKFDDVPLLIGTHQGEGKSTLVRWLAINDDYYGEVNIMEGQQAIEQLQGKWICEISELLALTKTKEQEAAKAYITRAVDTYRKPWDKNVTDLPRRCIMIGTTNRADPLSDKSGNRRWYPVEVFSNGYDLHDHEQECRDYIMQCWAEARERLKLGKMPSFADRKLVSFYRQAQEAAMQDDWRVGAILSFLETKAEGEYTCVRELCHRALSNNQDFPREPSLIESKDIGMIMNKQPDWKRVEGIRFKLYGRQRGWKKVPVQATEKAEEHVEDAEELTEHTEPKKRGRPPKVTQKDDTTQKTQNVQNEPENDLPFPAPGSRNVIEDEVVDTDASGNHRIVEIDDESYWDDDDELPL